MPPEPAISYEVDYCGVELAQVPADLGGWKPDQGTEYRGRDLSGKLERRRMLMPWAVTSRSGQWGWGTLGKEYFPVSTPTDSTSGEARYSKANPSIARSIPPRYGLKYGVRNRILIPLELTA